MTKAPPAAGLESPVGPRPPVRTQLPELPRHFVGRDEVTRDLAATLLERRLVSVVGPGGLGKTTLAVAVAWRLTEMMTGGICFLDLARLRDGAVLEAELGLALGMDGSAGVSREGLRQRLNGQRLLLVLDCCETVIGAAAELAEDLSAAVPELLILATSREPLRAQGEWVHRLAPLASPPESAALPAWLAMTYSALQLFFSLVQSRDATFAPTPSNLAQASALCSRLDGSPLAITLVASHARRVGMPGITAELGPELLSLGADGQTGRHSSLEAVLDWSYRLLLDEERRIFRALSTLRGSFDLETAVRVAGGPRAGTMDSVLDLTDKSLLMTLQVGDATLYRMPDLTRTYASARLERADEVEYRTARTRHAQALMQLLAVADQQWSSMERADWLRCYGVWIEDVRHALGWAFSDTGDSLLGAELMVAVLQLAEQSGLFAGFTDFASRALREVSRLDPPRPELAARLHVFPTFGYLRLPDDESHQSAAVAKAQDIHALPASAATKLGALLALWANSFQLGDYRDCLRGAADIKRLSDSDWVIDLTSRRTRAQALHFLGEHATARTLATAALAEASRRVPLAYTPSPVSLEVSMRIVLARIHWIEGRPAQAWQTVQDCLAFAEKDPPPAICQALALAAIPVALWCGRRDVCAALAAQLLEQASRYEFRYFIAWARLTERVLDAGGSNLPAHAEALKTLTSNEQTKYRDHLSTFEPDDISVDSFVRVQRGAVGWCAPEILRVKAEHVAAAAGPGAQAEASALLAQAQAMARRQGALGWELRVAMSRVRLSRRRGGPEPTAELERLAAVYDRFTEGLETRDLSLARELLGRS
ncbi:ATP-binding protein [Roseateles sp. BYS78W]|uniref:ATP-binding protein n=1 Tax=Pelomonas candidula TaxID=3299025 RepID=A0ABW7HH88_9BURK